MRNAEPSVERLQKYSVWQVAGESRLVVEDGLTLVAQGLRVGSEERGRRLIWKMHHFKERYI